MWSACALRMCQCRQRTAVLTRFGATLLSLWWWWLFLLLLFLWLLSFCLQMVRTNGWRRGIFQGWWTTVWRDVFSYVRYIGSGIITTMSSHSSRGWHGL